MQTKTLGNFLRRYKSDNESYSFAKDLTLEQFIKTSDRGDWILELFERLNRNRDWLFREYTTSPNKRRIALVLGKCIEYFAGNCYESTEEIQRGRNAITRTTSAQYQKQEYSNLIRGLIAFGQSELSLEQAESLRERSNMLATADIVYFPIYYDNREKTLYSIQTRIEQARQAVRQALAVSNMKDVGVVKDCLTSLKWSEIIQLPTQELRDRREKEFYKQVADICREYLPLHLWNQSRL